MKRPVVTGGLRRYMWRGCFDEICATSLYLGTQFVTTYIIYMRIIYSCTDSYTYMHSVQPVVCDNSQFNWRLDRPSHSIVKGSSEPTCHVINTNIRNICMRAINIELSSTKWWVEQIFKFIRFRAHIFKSSFPNSHAWNEVLLALNYEIDRFQGGKCR